MLRSIFAPQEARQAAEEKRQMKNQAKQELKQGVRTVPLNKVIKDVLDHLAAAGGPVAREELEGKLSLSLTEDYELMSHLHKHPKIKHR